MSEEKKERQVPQLAPVRRRLAEHARNHHVATVESAEHPEDFLKPEFWALIAKEVQLGDRVDVIDDAMTYFGQFIVVACDRTWVKLQLLSEHKLVPMEELSVSPEFDIVFRGVHLKFCVIRKSDRSVVHEGEPTREAANTWLLQYARTIGAAVSKPAAPEVKAKKAA